MSLLEQVLVLEGQQATASWVSIGQRESGETQISNMENKDEMFGTYWFLEQIM